MKSEELRYKVLELLPIFQQDVWKKLGLEHRQVSKVVLDLEKEGFLVRTKNKNSFYLSITVTGVREGRRLRVLKRKVPVKAVAVKKLPHVKVPVKKKESRFAPLVSPDGSFSPCTGCSGDECDPTTCVPLTKWTA